MLSTRTRQRLAPLAMTLVAWLVAFGAVTVLLALFGHPLGRLPLPLRALVISGVLVALMVNAVMPALSAAVAAWVRRAPRTPSPRTAAGGRVR